jgi:hypothetical protein
LTKNDLTLPIIFDIFGIPIYKNLATNTIKIFPVVAGSAGCQSVAKYSPGKKIGDPPEDLSFKEANCCSMTKILAQRAKAGWLSDFEIFVWF